jgi:hypothetical protein
MAERIEKLKATIHELERELASLDSVDQETRDRLASALAEISDALRRKDSAAIERHESLVEKLQEAAEEFESSHPNIAGILGRMVNVLGQMGIWSQSIQIELAQDFCGNGALGIPENKRLEELSRYVWIQQLRLANRFSLARAR